jgi:hypothetical protein
VERVKNDPLFFYQMLFPLCLWSQIEGEKCVSLNGIEGDTGLPYFSALTQFINIYASMNESRSGIGHGLQTTSMTELVRWTGVPICHGSLDGRPHTIHT